MSEMPIDSSFRIVGMMSEELVFVFQGGRIECGTF